MVLDDLGFNISMFSNLGGVTDVISWIILIVAIGSLLYLVYYLYTFKHTLIIREIINGRKIVYKHKWKMVKDKNNIRWLITPFRKLKKQLPPTESIDITNKAKKWVEAWRGDDAETFVWCHDNFDYSDFKKTHSDFQPLTTAERELLANEISKSNSYEKKTTMDYILQIVPILSVVILVAVISLTIGDVTSALTDFAAEMTQPLATVAESFERASENLGSIQNPDTVPVEEIPN